MDKLSYILKVTNQANSTDHCHSKFCIQIMPKEYLKESYFTIPSISTIKATEVTLNM